MLRLKQHIQSEGTEWDVYSIHTQLCLSPCNVIHESKCSCLVYPPCLAARPGFEFSEFMAGSACLEDSEPALD